MPAARSSLAAVAVAVALNLASGAVYPAAPASPAIQPFLCPEGGPNEGHAPQAMAKSESHLLVLCADTESEEGRGTTFYFTVPG